MIVRPTTLGRALRRAPLAPLSVAALLGGQRAAAEFRRIVYAVFPTAADAILAATQPGATREQARVWAFLHRVEAELFPVNELDEYEQVVWGVPFIRDGWTYDRFHTLDLPRGQLLMFALCAQPYAELDTRIPLLDAISELVPPAVLADIPEGGLTPRELHAHLDGTQLAAVADFADWVWGATGSVFLDLDDEVDVSDATWTPEVLTELTAQWQLAQELLDRIETLAAWFEADPAARFVRVLDAALGRDPHLVYQQERRDYAIEITASGLVPILREPDDPHVDAPVGDSAPGRFAIPLGGAG